MRGRRLVTLNTYLRTLAAFREHGLNFARVGRIVGMDGRTISKLWARGLPESKTYRTPQLPAIRDVIAGRANLPGDLPTIPADPEFPETIAPEVVAAPEAPDSQSELVPALEVVEAPSDPAPMTVAALVAAPMESESPPTLGQNEFAKHALLVTRAEWQGLEGLRDSAFGLNTISRQLLLGLQKKALRLRQQVEVELASDLPIDEGRTVKQLVQLGNVIEQAARILEKSITAERLVAGSPTEILRVIAPPPAIETTADGLEVDPAIWAALLTEPSGELVEGDDSADAFRFETGSADDPELETT